MPNETIIRNFRSWIDKLPTDVMQELKRLVNQDNQLIKEQHLTIYPEHNNIFHALELTNFNDVKAVILGQDPYHEPGQAMGLSFSVPEGTPLPPSLQNIFKEYQTDLGYPMPTSGDLTAWAKNGVLLLNTVLTVQKGMANSHKDFGWQNITRALVQLIIDYNPNPVVFILWGKQALTVLESCNTAKAVNKMAITSTHPSPFSANSSTRTTRAFMGSKPFSRTNNLLVKAGGLPINWELP
jgi:uracil-DNA glycosylase